MALKCHSNVIELALLLHCKGAFFMLYFRHKELIPMSLSKYIRTHKELSKLDFLTVYLVIVELLKDGKMEWNNEDV